MAWCDSTLDAEGKYTRASDMQLVGKILRDYLVAAPASEALNSAQLVAQGIAERLRDSLLAKEMTAGGVSTFLAGVNGLDLDGPASAYLFPERPEPPEP